MASRNGCLAGEILDRRLLPMISSVSAPAVASSAFFCRVLDQRLVRFRGIGRDYLLAELFVEALHSLPVVLAKQHEELVRVVGSVNRFRLAGHDLQTGHFRRGVPPVSREYPAVSGDDKRDFDPVLINALFQILLFRAGRIDRPIELIVFR